MSVPRSAIAAIAPGLTSCPGSDPPDKDAETPLGGPLAVLAVSEQPGGAELVTALQRELSDLTEDARFGIVQGATHESLISNPDHTRVVATRIQAVVQAARDRSFGF
jgi:hypothetical protein